MKERDKKKEEAVFCMRKIGLPDEVITQFEKNGVISRSCPSGGYVPIDGEQQSLINELEEWHDILVYFVIRSETGIGKIDSYLYVYDDEARWAAERTELENGIADAYFHVHKNTRYSAFCTVGFDMTSTGIRCKGRADIPPSLSQQRYGVF